MSKYYKAEDVISRVTEYISSDYPTEEMARENVELLFADLPAIEVSEDSVSKRYLLAEIDDLADEFSEVDENGLHSERWCGIMDSKGLIVNAPSATAEQSSTVGEWKWKSQDICDNCGYEIPHLQRVVGETVLMDSKDWKYCPNCGAKMKGASNGEDIQSADE